MSKPHIDYLVTAGLQLARDGTLRWAVPEEPKPTDYQRGAPWGPTSIQSYQERMRHLTSETADRVGAMLWVENHRSIEFRYDEEPVIGLEEPYTYPVTAGLRPVEPVVVLKALDCYEYQSCEHPAWLKSEAREFCDHLRTAAIRALPGYEEAPWEIRAE